MTAVTSFQTVLTRLVLATTLASITMATPQSIPDLDYLEILKAPSQEIIASDNIANLKMTLEGSNIMANGSLESGDGNHKATRDWHLQQVQGVEDIHFDYEGLNLDKTASNETELVDSNVISSRRGRMLGRLTKLMESATSALLGSSPEPEDPKLKNSEPQGLALLTNTSTQNPDESVQYVQAVRIPDHMRSQIVNKIRTKHQDQQHAGSSYQYDREGKNYANYNDESNSFLGNKPSNDTPTSQSLFETFQALFSKNMERSTGKSDHEDHQKPSRPLAQLDRRPFHSNPLNVRSDYKYGKQPSPVNYYNMHNDLQFFHEPTPLYVDEDGHKNIKSHFKSTSKKDSEYPDPKNYPEAFRPPRPYNTRPDAVASSVEITTFKPSVRYPVTTQTSTASNPKKFTTTIRRSDSSRKSRNAPVSLGILNHNLANADEITDSYHPESVRYDRHQTEQYRDYVSHAQEKQTKQSSRPLNLFDTNQRPDGNRDLIPSPHFQDSNELYPPSPRGETNNHRINRPAVEHHRDTNQGQHPISMPSRHPTSLPPHHHTFPPSVSYSSVERFTPPSTSIRNHWSPATPRPEATVITARPRQAKSVEYPNEDYYVRDKEPIFQDPRNNPMEVQYFEALEDEIRGSKFLTESVRLVSSNNFDDLIRETLANKKKTTQKSTKNVSERARPSRIRPSAPYNDIQSNEIFRGKNHPQTQAPRLIENKIVMDIHDTDDHHSTPRQNTRHQPAPTPSSDALIDSMYNFRNFETPMVKFSSKEAWRNIDINKYVSNEYSSQTEHPLQYPPSRPRDLHRPSSPTTRPPSPTSRRPSPTSRPPNLTSRPPSLTSRPPTPTSRPPSPTSRPPSPTSRPPSPTSRPPRPTSRPPRPVSPSTTVSRPPSPASRPHSSVSHPHSQVSRPHSPASRHHSSVSHPHSLVSHPRSQVSRPLSSVSHPHSQVSHPHSSVIHPHTQVSHPPSPVSRPPISVSHPLTEHTKTIVTKYYYEKPTGDKSVLLPQNDRFAAEHETIDHPFTKDNIYKHYELVDHFPSAKEAPLFTYGHPETDSAQSFFDEFHENHDDRSRTSGVFDHMFQSHKPRPSLSLEEIFLSKPLSRIDPPPGYHPFQGNSPPIPQRPDTLTTYRPKYSAAAEVPVRDTSTRFADDLSSNNRKLDDYSSIFTENMGKFHLSNMNSRRSNYHIGSEPTYGDHPTISIGVGASYQTTKSPSKRPGEPIVFTSMPYFEYSSRSGFPSEDITPQPISLSDKKEEPKSALAELVRQSRMSRSEMGSTSFIVPTISQTKQYVREPRMSRDEKAKTSFVVPTFSQSEMIATPSLLEAFFSQKKGKSLYERSSSVEQKPVPGSTEQKPELEHAKSLDSGGSITANADSIFPEHGYNIDEFFGEFPKFGVFEEPVEV